MSLVLKVACPSCGSHQDSLIGTEIRCDNCGNDYRAFGHGEHATRIISVTPDELEHIPYSQRITDVPRSSASSLILSDPALLDDLLLRDLPMKDNARWAGRVRLIKKLGQGGMGGVYRGFDESLSVDVAVKILPIPPGGKELHFADRFRQEARISAQINSPNVVRMRDVGENGTVIYLVMDFIDGQTVRQFLDRTGLVPVPQALQIIHDAALGMQAAHERGIIHRDIKLENILVANDGRVLLTDLGLAKATSGRSSEAMLPITRMGLLLGTPEYMSPEQWDIGAHITPRSDIWSMGVTLWVLLTRRSPFEDSDLGQLAKKIKEAPLPDIHTIRPDVPEKVASILYHCMAKNPQRRYMNSAALVSALSQAMHHPEQADDEFSVPPQTPSSLSIPNFRNAGPAKPPVLLPSVAAATAAPAAAVAKISPSVRISPAAKVVPILKTAPYVEPPRANPTPIVGPAKPKNKPDLIIRKKKSSTTRKLVWLSVPAAAACAAFAYYHYVGFGSYVPREPSVAAMTAQAPTEAGHASAKAPAPDTVVAIDVTAPKRVQVDESAVMSATLTGVSDPSKYEIEWRSGKEKPQSGANIMAQLKWDTEYDVAVIRVDSGKVVANKHIRIETDMNVKASAETGTDLNPTSRLEGSVVGGPGIENTEFRWYDDKKPSEVLSDKLVFDPQSVNPTPGSHVYVFEARRKGSRDWKSAAKNMVGVAIAAKIPVEFTRAMKDAEKFMKEAEAADTGSAAQLALKDALDCYETALRHQPEDTEALRRKSDALRRAKTEDDYAKLLSDSRELYYQAEGNSSDLTDKVKRLELALRPCRDAVTMLKVSELPLHTEVLEEMKRIQKVINVCTASIEAEKDAQKNFDQGVTLARGHVKEAEKYQNLSVALPHWEDAFDCFTNLKKQYPKLASNEGFQLESKKAQENYYKAYLFVTVGFIPAKPEDPLYQKQPRPAPTPRGPAQLPTSRKERGTILEQ